MNRIPLDIVATEDRAAKWEADEIKRQRRLLANAARRAADDDFGKLLYHRFQVIKARGEANALPIGNYLGPSLLAFVPLEQWLAKPNERAILQHYLRDLPEKYVEAALANPFITDQEGARKNTPIRLRFEEASIYGTFGECFSASRSKSWGKLVSVDPIEPNMPFDGKRIQYFFHKESRYNRRVEQRKYMKRRLGKDRPIVNKAMGATQKEFLKTVTEDAARRIKRLFALDPVEFWRAVNGKVTISRPALLEQGTLFGDET